MQPAPSITIDDIFAARDRILGNVLRTPCPVSEALSHLTGSRVVCKLEYLQRTGSFKERGACNALMLLKGKKLKGAVTASAGNHALALAYHGKRLGVPVTVVMPKFAPLIKSHNSRLLG
ncbi:MAG TPA: pyridoxal-phosphate dependent enzyme, partial [Tepidisphaeraceae bacterium]|nr:pyridoxal-phosphate dependent enzyme [Tepidisphaeraceae bacterium]